MSCKPNCYKQLMKVEPCCTTCHEYAICFHDVLEDIKDKQSSIPCATYDRMLDLLRPDLIEVQMDDVFRTLPKLNRFNGNTSEPYSVARHSIACVNAAIVEYKVSDVNLLITTLLHDAPEAYIGDIVKPLKKLIGKKIIELEKVLMLKFLALFDFTPKEIMTIKAFATTLHEIDTRMGATEARVLTKHSILPKTKQFNESYVQPHTWQIDEYVFKALYRDLTYTRELHKGGYK